jgi:hypothetical protein
MMSFSFGLFCVGLAHGMLEHTVASTADLPIVEVGVAVLNALGSSYT